MVRIALLSIAAIIGVVMMVTLLLTLLVILAVAALVAVPVYLIAKPHIQKHQIKLNPVERLQSLYVEGKIDLGEFEQRVARLVHIEN